MTNILPKEVIPMATMQTRMRLVMFLAIHLVTLAVEHIEVAETEVAFVVPTSVDMAQILLVGPEGDIVVTLMDVEHTLLVVQEVVTAVQMSMDVAYIHPVESEVVTVAQTSMDEEEEEEDRIFTKQEQTMTWAHSRMGSKHQSQATCQKRTGKVSTSHLIVARTRTYSSNDHGHKIDPSYILFVLQTLSRGCERRVLSNFIH